MMSEQARQSRDEDQAISLGIPILLLALAFFVFEAVQFYENFSSRSLLSTARANQEEPLKEIGNVKTSIHALASDAVDLAKNGNVAAKEAIEALAKQGAIKFAPPPQQQQQPPAKK
jgi:hypothetical protein